MSNDDTQDRVAALEAALAKLEKRLSAQAVSVTDRSMRATRCCPACAGRTIIHLSEIADDSNGGGVVPMAVSRRGVFFREAMGIFQAEVCARCGLVEWYIDQPDAIDRESKHVTITTEADSATPYR